MSPRSIRRTAALVAALALIVAACGGDDAAETTDPPVTTDSPATTDSSASTESTSGSTGAPSTSSPAAADSDRAVQEGDSVSVHYTGTLDNGEVFDSSVGGPTLDFVAGAGQMIPGFDAAVLGMEVGETKTVTLPPAEAYGERSDSLIIEIPLEQVPEGVTEGQELVDGNGNRVVVVEVRDDVVVIDANPRLAGESLTFEIELVSIN